MSTDWEHLRPQRVRHADGYEVYSVDREHVAYEDSRGTVLFWVERLTTGIGVEVDGVHWPQRSRSLRADHAVIVARTVEGLQAMGSQVEVLDAPPPSGAGTRPRRWRWGKPG